MRQTTAFLQTINVPLASCGCLVHHARMSAKRSIAVLLVCFVISAAWGGEVLVGPAYFPAVRRCIAGAQESVAVQMYFIIERDGGPVAVLVDELIAAHRRGVKVRVLLEDSKRRESGTALGRLQAAGVSVGVDTPGALLHTKALVVDARTCIVGSANWSRAAFEDNHEVSLLVESEAYAQALLVAFAAVPRRTGIPVATRDAEGVRVPLTLLAAGQAGSRMVTDRAACAFDLYLLLLRSTQAHGAAALPFDVVAMRRDIACHNVRRPRLRLEERYGLLTYDAARKQVRVSGEGAGDGFVVPYNYWEFGLDRRLSLRGKFMYLVALAEAAQSTRDPCWFRSQADLAARYGISDYTASLGLQELEHENIIEITRDEAEKAGQHADRLANVYCLNPLISPADLEARLLLLADRYGATILSQARQLAVDLNDPHDPSVIEALAALVETHGLPAVTRAHTRTLSLKKGSGRRTLQATIRALAGEP